MIDKLDAAFRFQQEALNLRNQRQSVLAANIANADTPGFKARDYDFASTLSQTMQRGAGGAQAPWVLTTTSARHLPAEAPSGTSDRDLMYRIPTQSSIDGNSVEMDTERVAFADNTVGYQSDLTVMTSKIKTMLAAIQQ